MPDEYQHLRESADAVRPGERHRCGVMVPYGGVLDHQCPLDPFEAVGFKPVPGLIQSLHAIYVEGKGYIVCRRGVMYGGRHGDAPFLEDPQKAIEIIQREARAAIYALASAHKRATG